MVCVLYMLAYELYMCVSLCVEPECNQYLFASVGTNRFFFLSSESRGSYATDVVSSPSLPHFALYSSLQRDFVSYSGCFLVITSRKRTRSQNGSALGCLLRPCCFHFSGCVLILNEPVCKYECVFVCVCVHRIQLMIFSYLLLMLRCCFPRNFRVHVVACTLYVLNIKHKEQRQQKQRLLVLEKRICSFF